MGQIVGSMIGWSLLALGVAVIFVCAVKLCKGE
jgi:hypothetical protein